MKMKNEILVDENGNFALKIHGLHGPITHEDFWRKKIITGQDFIFMHGNTIFIEWIDMRPQNGRFQYNIVFFHPHPLLCTITTHFGVEDYYSSSPPPPPFFVLRPKQKICSFPITCQKRVGSYGVYFILS